MGPRHANNPDVYNGYVNEARVYATALSGNQVAALYAQGADGRSVWTQTAGGGWNQGANWSTLFAADGVGQTADFGTLSLAADTTVALNESRTVGKLVFIDLSASHNWFLSPGAGGTLTLAADGVRPEIAVNNRTLTLTVPLAGTNGFVKTGAGTLVLGSVNRYQGPTVVAEGTLSVRPLIDGAVACYGFDDAANLGRDSSPQNNTLATSAGAPQHSADGRFGGALYLDGGSLLRTLSGQFPTGVPVGAAPYTVSAFIKASPSGSLGGGWIGYGNNANNRCNCFRL
ncbi:autotransporter-associated beta strand repeat-containing protein, partial [bacterium]|nr:autotransporter-associated beta strand repeat-containing protein [bacterium]